MTLSIGSGAFMARQLEQHHTEGPWLRAVSVFAYCLLVLCEQHAFVGVGGIFLVFTTNGVEARVLSGLW